MDRGDEEEVTLSVDWLKNHRASLWASRANEGGHSLHCEKERVSSGSPLQALQQFLHVRSVATLATQTDRKNRFESRTRALHALLGRQRAMRT